MNIEIIGRGGCYYCQVACETAENHGYTYYDYTTYPHYEELKFTHQIKTFPIVLVDKEYIGGYEELVELLHGTSERT